MVCGVKYLDRCEIGVCVGHRGLNNGYLMWFSLMMMTIIVVVRIYIAFAAR